MNKELINKYKPEFDHWLNEGKLLYKHINSNAWWDNEPWGYSPDYVTAIIINDEYAEFRKALAEGKTIQLNEAEKFDDSNRGWVDLSCKSLGKSTNLFPVNYYRIKPDEPKFKVGDFVRYIYANSTKALEINNINGNRYYFTNSEMACLEYELELWTPVKGEWCWFYDEASNKYSHLAKFNEMWNNRFRSTTDTPWLFCEPFLNSLPSYLKDK